MKSEMASYDSHLDSGPVDASTVPQKFGYKKIHFGFPFTQGQPDHTQKVHLAVLF